MRVARAVRTLRNSLEKGGIRPITEDERELKLVRRHLRLARQPWHDTELKRDLWPIMLQRMQETPVSFTFRWLESVLVATIVVSVAAVPNPAAVMLFHL
jgi:hypothetical protein